jgi:hypothetical protein
MNVFRDKYMRGINLGGWVSQYHPGLKAGDSHFDTFITEKDIEQIASWGLDHVRLPVDYMIFESDDNPGVYSEVGLGYIDNCLKWCKKYGLNLMIDLHHAPGFSFYALDTNSLFTDEDMQQRMINIWLNFTKRYITEGENLCFELMNELVEPDCSRWNLLAGRLVTEIRKLDKTRIILIGGNNYNAVSELKNIAIIDGDENIVYNFHFYEPLLFTHQLASWTPVALDYGQKPLYPSIFPGIAEFIEKFPKYANFKKFDGYYVDIEHMIADLNPALEFMKNNPGKILYCGEYGAVEGADKQSRINWHRDFNKLMDEYGIGRAVWSYKGMNFKFVEWDGKVSNNEMVDVIAGR